jgi:hypothetical protein
MLWRNPHLFQNNGVMGWWLVKGIYPWMKKGRRVLLTFTKFYFVTYEEHQDMNLSLLVPKLPSLHLRFVLNENLLDWPVLLNTKQLISSLNFIVCCTKICNNKTSYIYYAFTPSYLVFFDNILLFQAPKVLLNVEVTEATIMKPADANGMW